MSLSFVAVINAIILNKIISSLNTVTVSLLKIIIISIQKGNNERI